MGTYGKTNHLLLWFCPNKQSVRSPCGPETSLINGIYGFDMFLEQFSSGIVRFFLNAANSSHMLNTLKIPYLFWYRFKLVKCWLSYRAKCHNLAHFVVKKPFDRVKSFTIHVNGSTFQTINTALWKSLWIAHHKFTHNFRRWAVL